MKKIRIIFIILTAVWMAVVFYFSNEPKTKTENTSSSVTEMIVKVIYGENLEDFEKKVKEIDPIIRKVAHYTLYLIRRNFNCSYNFYI